MKEQLIRYVDLLFAGAYDADEIKQEILQNTLDRYDDLVSQGKSPEAAYRLAISGIGDINEILGSQESSPVIHLPHNEQDDPAQEKERKIKRAAAIAMYILCPIPLFILSEFGADTIGLCMTLMLVAAATALIILNSSKKESMADTVSHKEQEVYSPEQELRKSVNSVIWAIGLIAYFVTSFLTQAWHITWVIFPLIGAVKGLAMAIMDLKEVRRNEN